MKDMELLHESVRSSFWGKELAAKLTNSMPMGMIKNNSNLSMKTAIITRQRDNAKNLKFADSEGGMESSWTAI